MLGDLDDELPDALAGIAPRTRVVGLRTSAFVLGAAGMLDGRRVTAGACAPNRRGASRPPR
ncbi:hypothetical protein [Actinoallomurus iriomotensis]|uniref:hypothetical protein n=1 Tax=Actinoallomurus iriomotensis TaxID=478107 RepID=UPI0025526164|nr:hypothetical protein [Actinoallomurus iriomotensis]